MLPNQLSRRAQLTWAEQAMDDQSEQRSTVPNEDETPRAGRRDGIKLGHFAEDATVAFTLLYFIGRLAWEYGAEGAVVVAVPRILLGSLLTGLFWYVFMRWQGGLPSRFHRT
jgi:hypothetical protein